MQGTTPREVTQREIGWLAGILDGEGSLSFGKSKNKSSRYGFNLYNGIHIVNTNKEMIEKCSEIIYGICKDVHTRTSKTMSKVDIKNYKNDFVRYLKNKPKPCYQLCIRNKDWTIKILETLLPELTEKSKKAKALLEILKHRQSIVWEAGLNKHEAFYKQEDLDYYFNLWDNARRD